VADGLLSKMDTKFVSALVSVASVAVAADVVGGSALDCGRGLLQMSMRPVGARHGLVASPAVDEDGPNPFDLFDNCQLRGRGGINGRGNVGQEVENGLCEIVPDYFAHMLHALHAHTLHTLHALTHCTLTPRHQTLLLVSMQYTPHSSPWIERDRERMRDQAGQ